MKISVKIAILAGCAVLFSSCATTSSGTIVETYPRTQITEQSKLLDKKVQILQINNVWLHDLLQAQIKIQNVTRQDIQFEYMFTWFYKNGMKADSDSSIWIPISISAKDTAFLNAVAPSKDIKDYSLEIRFVRNSQRW